jgi:hypothetical protein
VPVVAVALAAWNYRLGYACQRENRHDRALRRVHKLCLRLGGDPADGERPDKPKRMHWRTYDRLIAELDASADRGQIKSHRSCMRASRFGQSPFNCSRHFNMLPRRPYFAISLATLYRPLRLQRVHSTRSSRASPRCRPKVR